MVNDSLVVFDAFNSYDGAVSCFNCDEPMQYIPTHYTVRKRCTPPNAGFCVSCIKEKVYNTTIEVFSIINYFDI